MYIIELLKQFAMIILLIINAVLKEIENILQMYLITSLIFGTLRRIFNPHEIYTLLIRRQKYQKVFKI